MSTHDDSSLEPQQFAILGVRADLLAGLRDLGFETPTPVQERVIPSLLLGGRDLVGLAQTGTGKTAAFGVPLLQLSNPKSTAVQGLVLCPTRELCVQVCKDIQAMGRHVRDLRSVAIYGGASIRDQLHLLKRGTQIVVATPGRLLDMLERRAVKLGALHTLVLDEADEMLNMGFRDAIDAIVAQTPDSKQTLLFSATMSREVKAIASNYMTDPISITVGKANAVAENVRHEYCVVHARDRYRALKRVVDIHPEIYGIIFCRTRVETQEVADQLIQDGYDAEALHGELSQSQRDFAMNKFRRRNLQMLVATDVAARGLDVDDLTHVINYNLPDENSVYTHRSGRTGRAGRTGCSITIVHLRERHRIRDLERLLHVGFEQKRIPTGGEICERQLLHLIENLKEVEVDDEQIDPYFEAVSEKLADLDRETLIKRFISVEFNRFLAYYKDAADLNVPAPGRDRPDGRDGRDQRGGSSGEFTRFTLNVGKDDGLTPTRLIGRLNQVTQNRDIAVGRISMYGGRTVFEADSRFIEDVRAAFDGSNMNGKRVAVATGAGSGIDRGARHKRNTSDGRVKNERSVGKKPGKGGRARNSPRRGRRSS